MKIKHNQMMTILFSALLLSSLTACGIRNTEAPAAEESTEEAAPDIAYVETAGLDYEEDTEVTTKGTLCAEADSDTPDVIDVDWALTNIMIESAEDGLRTVTIEQSVYGYIWTDDDIFKTSLNVPVARLCDIYTGRMISADEEGKSTEIEWKDSVHNISAAETVSWEDGDWNTDWVEDSDGGRRLSSTLHVETVVTIDEDYDGLALVLTPIKDAGGSMDGEYIRDVWTDGSHLFNVSDLSARFEKDKAGEIEEEDAEEEETEAEEAGETKTSEQSSREKPKEEAKSSHTHSYTGTVTAQPTCTAKGVKTYTCQTCGSFYTESIAAIPHDFSVPVVQLVHHDEQWETTVQYVEDHSQVIEVRCSACGSRFKTPEEYENHVLETIERETHGGEYPEGVFNACNGWYMIVYGTKKVYDKEKIADAYDAEEVVGYQCSMCGLSTVR